MNAIATTDQKLRQMQMPALQPFDASGLRDDDLLIVCGGFEDRALASLNAVSGSNTRPRVLLIDYLPENDANRSHSVVEHCEKHGLDVKRVTYDRDQPSGFGDQVLHYIAPDTGRVFLDVSAMSRLLIVQFVAAIRNSTRGLIGTHILYAIAKEYPPSEEEVKGVIGSNTEDPAIARLFLSSGVSEVTVVPELSAATLGGSQSRLVVFPTFNTDQLVALKNELQPSRLAYIHGVPPERCNQWRLDAITSLNWIDMKRDEHFRTSTLDYRETLVCLCDIYAKHAVRDRVMISPTGSKMQTVAVGLFRAFVADVQIVYPTPRRFSSPCNYTVGISTLYSLSLASFYEELECRS